MVAPALYKANRINHTFGSNHSNPENFGRTVEHCRKAIDPSRLLGFMQAPWRITTEEFRDHYRQSIDQVAAAMKG